MSLLRFLRISLSCRVSTSKESGSWRSPLVVAVAVAVVVGVVVGVVGVRGVEFRIGAVGRGDVAVGRTPIDARGFGVTVGTRVEEASGEGVEGRVRAEGRAALRGNINGDDSAAEFCSSSIRFKNCFLPQDSHSC